jgi:dTDP-4-amino-4,6-dideoxygalactose transaminase
MINVTKAFLPPIDQYTSYLTGIWQRAHLTNNGPLVHELEARLKAYLSTRHLFFMGNGTIAIQIAIKVLELKGEIITTPFSYVATTNTIVWENCKPVFVDIRPTDFNINVELIEKAITPTTVAILAVHVYGNPCDVQAIERIARKHNLKVIYDAAHAFGATYNGTQILNFGDVSTCSFHATKVFHTIEGGSIIVNDDELAKKIPLYRSFGHVGDDYFSIGINGKNSEFHAAMGLCNINYVNDIIAARKQVSACYDEHLQHKDITKPQALPGTQSNYAYYPVVFSSEAVLIAVTQALKANEINVRRYFYPSLNNLPHVAGEACPISEDITARVISLPLYPDLPLDDVRRISLIILQTISK